MSLAAEEARELEHGYLDTEHLLLGLLHEEEGLGARTLTSLGIAPAEVRRQVQGSMARGPRAPGRHVPFTPAARQVLEHGRREADQLDHEQIGTEHVLLGLVRTQSGVAARVLVGLGADLNRVRRQVLQLLAAAQDSPQAAARIGAAPMSGSIAARLDGIEESFHDLATRLDGIEKMLADITRPRPE